MRDIQDEMPLFSLTPNLEGLYAKTSYSFSVNLDRSVGLLGFARFGGDDC